MPLYEYACTVCDAQFERIQKFSDPLVTVCPTCGGAVRKLISSPAIQFKGAGWYVNDYAKPGSKAEPKSSESKGDGAKSSESKAEGSTASKTDSASSEDSSSKSDNSTKVSDSGSSTPPAKPAAK
jgi:putative FmdB family regulatory protein